MRTTPTLRSSSLWYWRHWSRVWSNFSLKSPTDWSDLVEIIDGKIRQIKKNLQGKDNSEFIGIVKFSSYGWKILIQLYNKLKENHEGSFHDANGFDDAYITDIIQELIELDYNIKPIFVKGNWLEIDTPQDLEIASKKLD